MGKTRKSWLVAGLFAIGALLGNPAFAAADVTNNVELVSKDSLSQPSASANNQYMTVNGRYIAFSSLSDLTNSDPNFANQVYLKDRLAGTLTVVSLNDYNEPCIGTKVYPSAVSEDGRFILLNAQCDNFAAPDGLFLRDRTLGTTTLIAAASTSMLYRPMSQDGAIVIYQEQPEGGSGPASMRVAIYNQLTGATTYLPLNTSSSSLSGNGHYVTYLSEGAPNTYQAYRYDALTGLSTRILSSYTITSFIHLSYDGTVATFAASTQETITDYAVNLATGQTTVLSNGQSVGRGNAYTSDDGKFSIFQYGGQQQPQYRLARVNLASGEITLLDSYIAKNRTFQISSDGSQVAFTSQRLTSNGVALSGPSQVFVATFDITAPTAANPAVTPGTIVLLGSLNISANAADSDSGVAGGEYYLDSDPGLGHGTSMDYSASTGKISATRNVGIGSLPIGQHTVYIRAKDATGNWSATVSKTFSYL